MKNNTIVDSWAGIKLGGGRRTIIVENKFAHVHDAIEFDNRGQVCTTTPLCWTHTCHQARLHYQNDDDVTD
eukprot:COSAG01_NODE_1902_length_8963_cov_29.997405_9_plen_71_part_00